MPISKLIKILLGQSLSSYHQMVVQAVMFIFRTLGKSVSERRGNTLKGLRTFDSKARPGFRDFFLEDKASIWP